MPDPTYRDGEGAVRDASGAIALARAARELTTSWKHRVFLQTLAAALAERGVRGRGREARPPLLHHPGERTRGVARIAQFERGEPSRVEAGWMWLVVSRPPPAG
jgi:hypothetical protein